MRPLAWNAMCSSWPGSGQKPSNSAWVFCGGEQFSGTADSLESDSCTLAGPCAASRCTRHEDLAGSQLVTERLGMHPALPRQQNRACPCMFGIVALARHPKQCARLRIPLPVDYGNAPIVAGTSIGPGRVHEKRLGWLDLNWAARVCDNEIHIQWSSTSSGRLAALFNGAGLPWFPKP